MEKQPEPDVKRRSTTLRRQTTSALHSLAHDKLCSWRHLPISGSAELLPGDGVPVRMSGGVLARSLSSRFPVAALAADCFAGFAVVVVTCCRL